MQPNQQIHSQPSLIKPFIYGLVLFEILPLAGPFIGGLVLGYMSMRGAIKGLILGEVCGIVGTILAFILITIIPRTNYVRAILGVNLLLGLLFTSAIGGLIGGWLANMKNKTAA